MAKHASNVSAEISISDTHVGHKAALLYLNPDLEFKPSESQKWLFKCWELFLDDVDGLLNKWKVDYVHSTWNGDLGDLDYKNRGPQEYWAHQADEVTANTAELFEPLAKMCNDIHVVMGNDAHVGKDGTLDNQIAKDFENVVPFDEPRGKYAHPSIDFELQGLLFNYVHKGMNRTKWTYSNGLNALKNEIVLNRAKNGERVPDFIGRGHFHYGDHTPLDQKPYVMFTPSWQLKSDYIRYIDPVDVTPHVGGYVTIIRDGKLAYSEQFRYSPERREPWRPKK